MDKNLDPDLIKNLIEIYKHLASHDPYILTISKDSPVTISENHGQAKPGTYNICSACYSIIDKTWDHSDWCQLYKEEAVSEWLKKGINEK